MSILDHLEKQTYIATGWNRTISGDEHDDTNDYYFPQSDVTFDFSKSDEDDPRSVNVYIGGEPYDARVKNAKEAVDYILSEDGKSLTAGFVAIEGQPINEVVTFEPQPELGEGEYLTHVVTFFNGMRAMWICRPPH
ncbi:MAG: hypothetical protein AAF756_19875 [Pseudomonadota bacterium]